MVGEASGGASSFDGNTIIKQVGSVPVNSRVTTDEETWGIPVDVNTSHRSYIKHTAMHLFAAAPLIECDDKGNIKYVSEAKVHQIAKECIKDANILHDELHAYKKDGSGSGSSGSTDGGKTKQQLQQENAALKEENDALKETNELNNQYIDSLKNAVKEKADDSKVSDKYAEKLEDKIKEDTYYIDNVLKETIKSINDSLKIDNKYVELLENKLKVSGITLPQKPSISDVGGKSDDSVIPSRTGDKKEDAPLPSKPTLDDKDKSDDSVLPEKPTKPSAPEDPDKPSEDKKYPISQIENVVKSN